MPLKTICFLGGFFICCFGALVTPLLGIVGGVLYYIIGTGWWTSPIRDWGVRYFYLIAISTIIGTAINWSKLRFGKSFLEKQEKFTLLFLAIVWISMVFAEKTIAENYLIVDHPSIRLTKIIIFAFLITHIVTRIGYMNVFFWALILGTILLDLRAIQIPRRDYLSGRLETVGGTDFRSANDLAIFLAVVLPVIGIMFLKTHWPGKIVCAASGVLSLSVIVLTRSRSGLLGLIGGAFILALFAPSRHRGKILACLILASIGFYSLMDERFITRSKTILTGTEIQDKSAQNRLAIWRGGIQMIRDNPQGVGAGNFMQTIGRYSPGLGTRDAQNLAERDAHSTYVRCAAELGLHGFAIFLILLLNAFVMLIRIRRRISNLPSIHQTEFQLMSSALAASLTVFIVSGLTGTLLYFESFWWWLLLPVCLQRCLNNQLEDIEEAKKQEESSTEKSGKRPVSKPRTLVSG